MNSDIPVARPFLTDALVAKIHAANEEEGERQKAAETTFRNSEAGACARKMAYSSLGYERTEPNDLSGEWVMYLGKLIGEKMGEALHNRYGSSCELEVKVHHGGLTSGHIDALIHNVPDIGTVAYELKTKGGYGFNKCIGLDRKSYSTTIPEGPGLAKLQGALYAHASDADLLVIGVIGLEAVSKQLAAKIGWGDLQRIMAEWHYSREEFTPWAKAEIARMEAVAEVIDGGRLPPRICIGDEFEEITLNPTPFQQGWRCVYCPFTTQCVSDGPGVVVL